MDMLLIGMLIGLALGFGLSMLFDYFKGDSSSEEIGQLKEEHAAYRKKVDDHFVNSAVLFKGLTEQYRDVYRHIAGGAGDLCSDEAKALQVDLDEPMLLGKAEEKPEPIQGRNNEVNEASHDVEASSDDNEDDTPLASEVEVSAEVVEELKKQAAKKE